MYPTGYKRQGKNQNATEQAMKRSAPGCHPAKTVRAISYLKNRENREKRETPNNGGALRCTVLKMDCEKRERKREKETCPRGEVQALKNP
jgi:hypothetical protein